MRRSILMIVCLVAFVGLSYQSQDKPVIGMFMQPSATEEYPSELYTWVDACDVQHWQSEGAQIVPIYSNYTYQEIEYLLQRVNGVHFPGGSADLWIDVANKTGFTDMTLKVQYILNRTLEFNRQGDFFPIQGTCLGLELLTLAYSNYSKIMSDYNDDNDCRPSKIINEGRIFRNMSSYLKSFVKNADALYVSHMWGLSPSDFDKYMSDQFTALSIMHDYDNLEYIGSYQHNEYPIYAIQFHPEIPRFNFRNSINATHSPLQIEVSKYFANFFVNEVRLNNHSFEDEELLDRLTIYNFSPIHLNDSYSQQEYFFDNLDKRYRLNLNETTQKPIISRY